MVTDVFMWRMKAREIRDHYRDSSEGSVGHGVTDRDINEAFDAADRLYEALQTIENKVEDNEP